MADEKTTNEKYSLTNYGGSTVSQISIGDKVFNITDANTRETVATLCDAVSGLDTTTTGLVAKTEYINNITYDKPEGSSSGYKFTFNPPSSSDSSESSSSDSSNSNNNNKLYSLGIRDNGLITYGYYFDSDWHNIFNFQINQIKKIDIEPGTLTGGKISVTNSSICKLGNLVIGSFILQDPNPEFRDNTYDYTLVKGLPMSSYNSSSFIRIDAKEVASPWKDTYFKLEKSENETLLKWCNDKNLRTNNSVIVNIMYTASS